MKMAMNEIDILNAIKTSPMLTNPLISIPLKMYFNEQLERKLKEHNLGSNIGVAQYTKTDLTYTEIKICDYAWTNFSIVTSIEYPTMTELDEFKRIADAYVDRFIIDTEARKTRLTNELQDYLSKKRVRQLWVAFLKTKLVNSALVAGLLSACLFLNIPSTIGRITFSCLFALIFRNSAYWQFLLKKVGKFDVDEMMKNE